MTDKRLNQMLFQFITTSWEFFFIPTPAIILWRKTCKTSWVKTFNATQLKILIQFYDFWLL